VYVRVCVLFKNIKLFGLDDTITDIDKNLSTRFIKQINIEKYRPVSFKKL